MKIIVKGSIVFVQSYNPTTIERVEKRANNQVVHSFYSSPDTMRPSDRYAFYAANRLNRVYGA